MGQWELQSAVWVRSWAIWTLQASVVHRPAPRKASFTRVFVLFSRCKHTISLRHLSLIRRVGHIGTNFTIFEGFGRLEAALFRAVRAPLVIPSR